MLQGGPKGALGLANPSGWITEEGFYQAMKHFIKFVKPSEESPCLILCDNHTTHITIDIVMLARENHISILTFPPHCSHRLQPLDVSVYAPFKNRYRDAMNFWMISNPGKPVTIYEVAQFANTAYTSAFSMENIIAGFRKTGIHPFNRYAFSDDDFLTSFVTDRPIPEQPAGTSASTSTSKIIVQKVELNQPKVFSPEQVRPYPKALPRKQTQRPTRKMKSTIITNTPEKDKIIEKLDSNKKKTKPVIKKLKTTKNIKKLTNFSSESSSDFSEKNAEKDCYCAVCKGAYSSSSEDWLKCAMCNKWTHETCGLKGPRNFFCNNCN